MQRKLDNIATLMRLAFASGVPFAPAPRTHSEQQLRATGLTVKDRTSRVSDTKYLPHVGKREGERFLRQQAKLQAKKEKKFLKENPDLAPLFSSTPLLPAQVES